VTLSTIEIRHAHFFCGIGGGAKGFNNGQARVGQVKAKFRCIGGIDVDAGAVADFGRIAGVPGTVLDLFTREQYLAFHGRNPPADWREAMPADVQAAFGNERPHILFLSAPCKGFSGLLSEEKSKSGKYQALNQLTLRGLWLALEAWKDDLPDFILFENVPRIQNRGRRLLDQIIQLLQAYGYATSETTHDCGHLGNLAQSRKRFLLVARHQEKIPPFVYQPQKRSLRAVGQVLEKLPLPGVSSAGAMHRMPSLQWKTWVRLAFVKAGSDWRSLRDLRVADGYLTDFSIVPEWAMHNGVLGVCPWSDALGTVQGSSLPTNGRFSVADPRISQSAEYGQLGVRKWKQPTGTVTGQRSPGQGGFAVADPRVQGERFNHIYRIVGWDQSAPAVTSANSGTAAAIADPRPNESAGYESVKYRVTRMDEPAGAVIAASGTGNGAYAVADPRPAVGPLFSKYPVSKWEGHAGTVIGGDDTGAYAIADPRINLNRQGSGNYGVVPWMSPARAVTGRAKPDNSYSNVADPRLPVAAERLVCVIRALDGTWHRPFTTLELAALQGFIDTEEHLELEGLSDSAWRERIGNAVPPPAAAAIAGVVGRALLIAWSGETYELGLEPVWVRPVAIALSLARVV